MYRLATDGGAANNQNQDDRSAGCGIVIVEGGERLVERSISLGDETNNTAEYEAVIQASEILRDEIDDSPSVEEIVSDSQLVINQAQGEWDVNKDYLDDRHSRVHDLLSELDVEVAVFTYQADSEDEDLALADQLAKEAT